VLPHEKSRLFLGTLVIIVTIVALVAEWIERRTESPIMRQRVNEGSDEFLDTRGSVWKAAMEQSRRFFRP
jgi:hypothetical protein